MKLLSRISDFPFTLRQENRLWCIAASVEAILTYYDAELNDHFQLQLSCAMFRQGGFDFTNALSVLNNLKEQYSPRFDSFSFETDSLGFDELISKIKGSIDLGNPII